MSDQPTVLVISSDEAELSVLVQVLSEHAVLHSVRELGHVEGMLKDVGYDAVFCGWSVHGGTWYEALGQVQLRDPDLPVVVICRTAGEREWIDVLDAGGFDLLVPPFEKFAVLAVLEQAVGSYEVRHQRSLMLSAKTS
jgi:DNA-binding NtrC family response regulator